MKFQNTRKKNHSKRGTKPVPHKGAGNQRPLGDGSWENQQCLKMLKKNDFQPGILPSQIINQTWGRRIKTILDRLKTNVLSYSVGGQRFEMGLTGLKSVSRAAFLLGLQGEHGPLPVPAMAAACIPWLETPASIIFKASSTASSNVSLIQALLPPSCKDPVSTLGPHG